MTANAKTKLYMGITFTALVVNIYAWLMVNLDLLGEFHVVLVRALEFQIVRYPITPVILGLIMFGFVINFLMYGSVVFIFTRLGYLRRSLRHQPDDHDSLSQIYERAKPAALTILVPSYKEEPEIVERTLLSAALLEYPRRRVVLLIDDPPAPKTQQDYELLKSAQQLPAVVQNRLQPLAIKLMSAQQSFETRRGTGAFDLESELLHLANLYKEAALWFEEEAREYDIPDHSARFFVDQILKKPADTHRQHARDILALIVDERSPEDVRLISREYRRLASLFDVEMVSFERKRFANLSHEANKAMNLNSYIGLMGGDWTSFQLGPDVYLQPEPAGMGGLQIPHADYIITLDADSLLMHDYALRLIHKLEKPGNERIAIMQTPYNAFPGAAEPLEKIAGAQTDMQYVVHQGFTQHEATFWVGANALLRKEALDDIVVEDEERGHRVKKYIQDRTVIEDTESSIDLVEKGWQLFNYPARLAFSATPPDFGSLLIQRRRWANGGLIIFPKMVRYALNGHDRLRKAPEVLLRTHYLISTSVTNLGLLLLIIFGADPSWLSSSFILSLCFYFLIYGISLREAGYRGRDLFHVTSLNFLLIPVNLAGALKSIQQAVTGRQVPFARTPKVGHRTASPAWLMLVELALVLYCLGTAVRYLVDGRWLDSSFAWVNGLIIFYGVTRFIGWRHLFEDLTWPVRRRLVRKPKAPSIQTGMAPSRGSAD